MRRVCKLLCLMTVMARFVSGADGSSSPPDFGRDVFPILQRSCFECHGPEKAEGGLRLDSREGLLKGGDNGAVILREPPSQSELLRRIELPRGHDEIMPARGEPLSRAQRNVLKRWVESGGHWPDRFEAPPHWAYQKPVRPPVPGSSESVSARTTLDGFVRQRLAEAGLKPSPAADPATLIRRISLDLIGLPPSPAEVDEFLADVQRTSLDGACERLVDRLLASPQFGVRWARPWLDYARYADSHGFQRDDFRDLWPYRDWVVDALNADMPFDQFTIEQLAGDLLPNATEAQKIATGFNRSAPTNVEAGSDPEETRVNQVFDRVNTLGMIWLGTTLECCQCHDHKYDPFTMRDYYGLFAFFNQTAIEADRSNPKVPGSIRFLGPEMPITDKEHGADRLRLNEQKTALQKQLAERRQQLETTDPAWEARLLKEADEAPREHVLAVTDFESAGGATHEVLTDGSVLISGEAPDTDTYTVTLKTDLSGIRALKLETLTHESLPGMGPGRGDAERPNFVLHSFEVTSAPSNDADREKGTPLKFVRAVADFSQARFDVSGAIDDDQKTAWAINPQFHQPHWARFETAEPIGFQNGTTLTVRLIQNYGSSRTIGRFRILAITGRPDAEALPAALTQALQIPAAERSKEQNRTIAAYRESLDPEIAAWQKSITDLDARLQKLQPPTTLIMQEQPGTRISTILRRGDFRTPGEPVEPSVPAILHPLPEPGINNRSEPAGPLNRLALAQWLVSPQNPLVARVTVNRWWAELFGQGLVTTPEDFGVKGDLPSHPELLDWLAVEFMEHNWSMKHILKIIVLSDTYRQSSRMDASQNLALEIDPANRLLWRGARFRMDAEMIRDNALAVAGLLSLKLNGPPVKPYQPDGLWVKVGGQRYDYVVSPGEDRYRRGLYVVWKRGAPYPSFINFDANNRLACRVKRPRSNTPLQALTLMNDPVYVEAAKALALRVLSQHTSADENQRLRFAFQLATAREPRTSELSVLRTLLQAQRESSPEGGSAKEFSAGVTLPGHITPADFAAWYTVAAALLNLDETITRP